MTFLKSGIRESELAALNLEDVDFLHNELPVATEAACQALITDRFRRQLDSLREGLTKRPPTHHGTIVRDTPSEVEYAIGPVATPRLIHAKCSRG